MADFIPEDVLQEIEELKKLGKFEEATRIVNSFLVENPTNEDALLQIADIKLREGNLKAAWKAIDFFNVSKNYKDPVGLYVK